MFRQEDEIKEEANARRRAKRAQNKNSTSVKKSKAYANGYSTGRCGRPKNKSLKADTIYWAEYERGHEDGQKYVSIIEESPAFYRGKANGTAWMRCKMERNDISEMEYQTLLTARLEEAKISINENEWPAYERGFIKGSETYFKNDKANKHKHKKRNLEQHAYEVSEEPTLKRSRVGNYDPTLFAFVVTELRLSQEFPDSKLGK